MLSSLFRRTTDRLVPLSDRHVIWLPEHRLAYLRVPKAANSSIRAALARRFALPRIEGMSAANDRYWVQLDNSHARIMTPGTFQHSAGTRDAWIFSFVRHPVARLYSCWNNKLIENEELTRGFVDMGLVRGMDFADFVARVAELPDECCDIHVRSQASILLHNGRLMPDFVGRVEHTDTDWEHVRYEVQMRCGRDLGELPQKNVRGGAGEDANGELTPAVEALIRRRFAQDFELFYPE